MASEPTPAYAAWTERSGGDDEHLESPAGGRGNGRPLAQDRLPALLRVHAAITRELSLPDVLRHIAESACHLLDAPYGALGVLNPDRQGLEEFIHIGIDDETAARIGHLPRGEGLLGALIVEPRPIWLRDLTTDARSVGFPEHHPPMHGFLGVPIRVRDEVFGNLYLADDRDREFTAEDQELAESLAATAATAIANARLYDEATRRQAWLEASTELTRELLTDTDGPTFARIASVVHTLAAADLVTVVLPTHDGRLKVVSAVGDGADSVEGMRYRQERSFAGRVLHTGTSIRIRDAGAAEETGHFVHVATALPAGPLMALPMTGAEGPRGVLMATRRQGRRPFTEADVEMATTFAVHASIALELAQGRLAREQMIVLEDRARIARDLHDHVIQQLFGVGLTLQATLPTVSPAAHESLGNVIDRLDDSIRQIRTAIFGLRPRTRVEGTLRAAVLRTADEAGRALGFAPQVRFDGPLELVVIDDLAEEVVAVVREALANIARHAQAASAQVQVRTDGNQLSVRVVDDGVGMADPPASRSGLANLDDRARARGGRLEIASEPDHGTVLTWRVGLD